MINISIDSIRSFCICNCIFFDKNFSIGRARPSLYVGSKSVCEDGAQSGDISANQLKHAKRSKHTLEYDALPKNNHKNTI